MSEGKGGRGGGEEGEDRFLCVYLLGCGEGGVEGVIGRSDEVRRGRGGRGPYYLTFIRHGELVALNRAALLCGVGVCSCVFWSRSCGLNSKLKTTRG